MAPPSPRKEGRPLALLPEKVQLATLSVAPFRMAPAELAWLEEKLLSVTFTVPPLLEMVPPFPLGALFVLNVQVVTVRVWTFRIAPPSLVALLLKKVLLVMLRVLAPA